MKCIKFYPKSGGHVARVVESVAAEQVAKGNAMYCPKRWFKAAKLKEANE